MIKELRVACGKCGNPCGTFYQQLGNIMFVSDDNGNVVDSEPKNPDAPKTEKTFNWDDRNNVAEVGSMINFTLAGGEAIRALCVAVTGETALFLFYDCLKEEYPLINESGDYPGWDACDLRKTLNEDILARFPATVRENMIPFPNGDYLRLPTEKEIFGVNEYGEPEPDSVKQFAPMRYRRNRIAFMGAEGEWNWYWLANRSKRYATYACRVSSYGNAYYGGASHSLGVRPLFGYRNIPTAYGGGKVLYAETDAHSQNAKEGAATQEDGSEGDE